MRTIDECHLQRPITTSLSWPVFMVKTLARRLLIHGRVGRLVADNPDYPAIELNEGLDYRILGVVRYRIGEL